MSFVRLIVPCLAVAILLGADVRAQEEKSDIGYFIDVRRKQIELRNARSHLTRSRDLFNQGLLPEAQLDSDLMSVERAQLDYQQALLTLLSVQPRITVERAVKFQSPEGSKSVRLTLANRTPQFDEDQLQLLTNFEGADPLPEALKSQDLKDLFVSLKDTGDSRMQESYSPRGTTIAFPYEVHIEEFPYGTTMTLDFQLLQDVSSVVVSISHKGRTRELDVRLQQAATEDVVKIEANQITLEADLGTQADFELLLERPSVNSARLELRSLNLPRQIAASFVEPETEARISQINLPAGVTRRRLILRLFLPERADESVPIDRPIEFWAVASASAGRKPFTEERHYSEEEIRQSRSGALKLAVIPRGVGRLEVSAANLFSEIAKGESVRISLPVRNAGTRVLDNTEIAVEAPLDWKVRLDPPVIAALSVGEEVSVDLTITPPRDVAAGDYEVRIRTRSYAYNRLVPSEDKIYRVSVESGGQSTALLALSALLLAIVVGMVVVGVRLTRR